VNLCQLIETLQTLHNICRGHSSNLKHVAFSHWIF